MNAIRRSYAERGFTLIELMIVVAIIAIIAAVAYPAYTNSIVKGKRGQGRAALLDLMQQQERYLTQTGSYVAWNLNQTSGTINNGTVPSIPFKTFSGDDPNNPPYRLYATTCPNIDPLPLLNECVAVYASPTFPDTEVGTLAIQSTGVKSCSGTNSTACW